MALKIRLARAGAKKNPFYRIVVADERMPRDGRFIERLGTYDPMVGHDHPRRLVMNQERIEHWLGAGARPTDRVARFLQTFTIPEQTKKSKPKAKAVERAQERLEKTQTAETQGAEAQAAEGETVSTEEAVTEDQTAGVSTEDAAEAPAEASAEDAPAAEDAPTEEPPKEEAPEEGTLEDTAPPKA